MSNLKRSYYPAAWVTLIICALLFVLCKNIYAGGYPVDDVPNIIICTLGGVRNSETIDDENHQYIPNLWNKILPQGTLYTNLINVNLSFHQPSVQAINTGLVMPVYAKLKVPSIFQYVIKQCRLPANKVWAIGHWNAEETIYCMNQEYDAATIPSWVTLSSRVSPESENVLSKPELNSIKAINKLVSQDVPPEWERTSRISFSWTFWDAYNELRHRIVKKVFKNYKPKFLHFVMDGVDCAHYDTFARYVLTIKDADESVFEIWKYIQSAPFYKDNTYLFITSDHGRDRYYMQHSESDSTRQTWLYVYGPKIKKDIKIGRAVYHTDIFATIASILNLKTHPIDGKVLEDCFLKK